jgi:hypothetical protein
MTVENKNNKEYDSILQAVKEGFMEGLKEAPHDFFQPLVFAGGLIKKGAKTLYKTIKDKKL